MSGNAREDHWVTPLIAAGTLAYLAAAAVLMVRVGDPLFDPLHNYFPPLSWLLSEADFARIKALNDADRWQTAVLYQRLEIASVVLVGYAGLVGGVGAFTKARRLEVTTMGLVALGIGCLLFYALFTVGTGLADLASNAGLTATNFSAYPGLWFLMMLPAAALFAFTVGLIAHTLLLRALVPAAMLAPTPEEDPVYY
jgi:hypothetical protein